MKEIYKKLFEVKKEWIILLRDTEAYNYKYATLDQIQENLSPILEKLWLLVVHNMSDWVLNTLIVDIETWDKVTSSIELTTTKPQDKWSEITYFRRYNLLCLLDLTVEDDDWKKAQYSKQTKKAIWDKEMENIKIAIEEWKYIDWLSLSWALADKYTRSDKQEEIMKWYFK